MNNHVLALAEKLPRLLSMWEDGNFGLQIEWRPEPSLVLESAQAGVAGKLFSCLEDTLLAVV